MRNITFRVNDVMTEIKLVAALDSEGIRWKKRGVHIEAIGVNEELCDVIMDKADKYWCW